MKNKSKATQAYLAYNDPQKMINYTIERIRTIKNPEPPLPSKLKCVIVKFDPTKKGIKQRIEVRGLTDEKGIWNEKSQIGLVDGLGRFIYDDGKEYQLLYCQNETIYDGAVPSLFDKVFTIVS